MFFNELLLSGRAANSGSGAGFAQGYAASMPCIRQPRAHHDDIPIRMPATLTLTSSQIYTLSGGNISILVPGGAINVGLAFTPVGVAQKPASELGIVAEGSRQCRHLFAQGDVNVNGSRIFTLGGGNILIWSDTGSIDAGNGSKSSLSVPPPVVTVNNGTDGVSWTLARRSPPAAASARSRPDPDVPAGTWTWMHRSARSMLATPASARPAISTLRRRTLLGVDNINFGGTASGVPSDRERPRREPFGRLGRRDRQLERRAARRSMAESNAASKEAAPSRKPR